MVGSHCKLFALNIITEAIFINTGILMTAVSFRINSVGSKCKMFGENIITAVICTNKGIQILKCRRSIYTWFD